MAADEALLWFQAYSASDVPWSRRDLDALPTSPSLEGRCADDVIVTVANRAGPDGSGIEIHVALGPDVSDRVRAETLAVINSVA